MTRDLRKIEVEKCLTTQSGFKMKGSAPRSLSSVEIQPRLYPKRKLIHQPKSHCNQSNCFNMSRSESSQNTAEQNFNESNEVPKLRRQLPVAVTVSQHKQIISDEILVPNADIADDFEYFCSISNSKISSMNVCESESRYKCENIYNKTRKQRQWQIRSQSLLNPKEQSEDKITNFNFLNVQNCSEVFRRRNRSKCVRSYTHDYYDGNTSDRNVHEHQQASPVTLSEINLDMSANSSTMNVSHSNRASYSPNRFPMIPRTSPQIMAISCNEMPLGSAISKEASDADDPDLIEFRVQVVGSPGVGKTSICQRLAQLNGDGNMDEYLDNDFNTFSIRATLYGRCFNVYFAETLIHAATDSMDMEIHEYVDAYLLVYAIDDESTFEFIKRVLYTLSQNMSEHELSPAAFIIAANKSDLVRARKISSDEGFHFAQSQNSRFIEISASLNHMIPELLLTIINHMNTLDDGKQGKPRYSKDRRSSRKKIPVNIKETSTSDSLFPSKKISNILRKYLPQSFFKS